MQMYVFAVLGASLIGLICPDIIIGAAVRCNFVHSENDCPEDYYCDYAVKRCHPCVQVCHTFKDMRTCQKHCADFQKKLNEQLLQASRPSTISSENLIIQNAALVGPKSGLTHVTQTPFICNNCSTSMWNIMLVATLGVSLLIVVTLLIIFMYQFVSMKRQLQEEKKEIRTFIKGKRVESRMILNRSVGQGVEESQILNPSKMDVTRGTSSRIGTLNGNYVRTVSGTEGEMVTSSLLSREGERSNLNEIVVLHNQN